MVIIGILHRHGSIVISNTNRRQILDFKRCQLSHVIGNIGGQAEGDFIVQPVLLVRYPGISPILADMLDQRGLFISKGNGQFGFWIIHLCGCPAIYIVAVSLFSRIAVPGQGEISIHLEV